MIRKLSLDITVDLPVGQNPHYCNKVMGDHKLQIFCPNDNKDTRKTFLFPT